MHPLTTPSKTSRFRKKKAVISEVLMKKMVILSTTHSIDSYMYLQYDKCSIRNIRMTATKHGLLRVKQILSPRKFDVFHQDFIHLRHR